MNHVLDGFVKAADPRRLLGGKKPMRLFPRDAKLLAQAVEERGLRQLLREAAHAAGRQGSVRGRGVGGILLRLIVGGLPRLRAM